MMKGAGSLNRKIVAFIGNKNKRSFEKNIPRLVENLSLKSNGLKLPLHLVSFSGEKFLNDQLYSILSFYWNVGLPLKWTIFDDGSYTAKSIELLNRIPNLEFIHYDKQDIPPGYPVEQYPPLKKIFLYRTIEIDQTTIFVDSDVLFFKPFRDFIPVLQKTSWFLPDEHYGYFDPSYVESIPFDMYPCNLGLLIFNAAPDWSKVTGYIDEQLNHKNGIMIWTDQTAFHKLTREYNGIMPLDPRYFIVSGTDSFKIGADFNYTKIAVRHFVGPVRHKMWQIDWRQFEVV